MPAIVAPEPKAQFFDTNGNVLAGGKLYSYQAGTSTPLATYTDQGAGTANANPVVLDAAGRANVWLAAGSAYKLILKDSTDATIWTVDNLNVDLSTTSAFAVNLAASSGSSLLGFLQAGTGAVARTVQAKLREAGCISVKDFGAVGDGVTNDTTAFANAITAAGVGGRIEVPPGVYVVNGLTLLNRQSLIGLGGAGGGAAVGVVLKRSTGTPTGITTADGNQRLHVANLDLQGYTIGLDCRGVNYSYFENLHFADCGRAIYLGADVSQGSIGNTFVHLRATGSTVRDLDSDTTVSPNNINNNRFIGCTFESSAGSAILKGIGGNGAAANGFVGCEFLGLGIFVQTVVGVSFSGECYFEGGTCIDLDDGCRGVSVHGCYFQNFATTGAIRVGRNNGANNGSGAGLSVSGNTFLNMQNNAIGINILSSNLTDVFIGGNHHDTGGLTYTRVSDANNIAATPMENTAIVHGQGSTGAVSLRTNRVERLAISTTAIQPKVLLDLKTDSIPIKIQVIATGSLPSADASNDGKILIEDAGAGDRNLIIMAGGQRFRIDGGVPF